jgi:hypothetical protein
MHESSFRDVWMHEPFADIALTLNWQFFLVHLGHKRVHPGLGCLAGKGERSTTAGAAFACITGVKHTRARNVGQSFEGWLEAPTI